MQSNQNTTENTNSRPQRSTQPVDSAPNEIRADAYFAIVPEWVIDDTKTGNAVKLYAVLARYADKGTGVAHPSRKTLARRMGFARAQTVDPIVLELETIGAIEVFERRNENGDRSSNGYIVRTMAPAHRVVRSEGPGGDAPGARGVVPPTAQKPESVQPESVQPEKNTSAAAPGAFDLEVEQVDVVEESFAKVWQAWPRTESKKASLTAYRKAVKKASLAVVEGSALAWAQGACARRDANQFQPLPYLVSWLNQERWQESAPRLDPVAPAGFDRDRPTQRVQAALDLGAQMDAQYDTTKEITR